MEQDYSKLKIQVRSWMQGRGYDNALRAMDFAAKFHTGTRKDNQTPEFQHQLSQAQFIINLAPLLMHPEETLATVFLHDVQEDYGVESQVITDKFGKDVARHTWNMTKEFNGVAKKKQDYFDELAKDPVASVAKGLDRIHNLSSMIGVFRIDHQKKYAQEVRDYFLPMLKEAQGRFPQQQGVYETLKYILKEQLHQIDAQHKQHDRAQRYKHAARKKPAPNPAR